nr:toll-like receptor 3 isoform X2 [Crassostrea gigas]
MRYRAMNVKRTFLWCLFLVGLVVSERCGDGHCKCTRAKKVATCMSKKRQLNYFPTLPSYVRQLKYSGNYLPNLTRDSLINMTRINLTGLNLDDNMMKNVDPNAFEDLTYLVKLQISHDKILNGNILASALYNVSRSVEKLVLQHNKWDWIPDNVFDGLNGSNVYYIDLSYNNLRSFNGTRLLLKIPRLKYLILDENPLSHSDIDFHNMEYMFKISLQNTYVQKVPKFCDGDGESFLPRLRSLYLDRSSMKSVTRDDFPGRCLPFLWKLSLSFSDISSIQNDTFAGLPVLKYLLLQNMVKLRLLDYFAFHSASLELLNLGSSKFKFVYKGRYNNDLFKFTPNMNYLSLFDNQITDGSTLKTLLWHLVRLQKLNLQSCDLNYLARGTFDRMLDLRIIILKGNSLYGWDPDMFSKLSNLNTLYLSGNNIAVVNRTSLEFIAKINLEYIDLANNPLACSCQQLWFRDWLKESKNITVPHYPSRYVCRSPPEWDKKMLASFNYTEEDCREKNPWILIGSVLGSVVFVCMVVVIVIYTHLPTVRNIIYLIRLRRKGYVRLVNSEEYMFDCYVVSCETDEHWVFQTLYSTLEDEYAFHLCIPSRDFDVGESKADQIEEKMKESKKIIIVMSNDFAQDEWCQFQLEKAQERIRNQGKEAVVLIMLRDIDHKHMTSTIKNLLRKSSYATWVKGKIATKLFWDIVVAAIEKPFGNPPVAI